MGNITPFVFLIIIVGIFVVYIWSLVLVYRDIEARRHDPLLITMLIAFLAWPSGLVLWYFLRPEKPEHRTE